MEGLAENERFNPIAFRAQSHDRLPPLRSASGDKGSLLSGQGGVPWSKPWGRWAENGLPCAPPPLAGSQGHEDSIQAQVDPAPSALEPAGKAVGSPSSLTVRPLLPSPPLCVTHASSLLPEWRVTAQGT